MGSFAIGLSARIKTGGDSPLVLLEALRDRLTLIPGVATCRIGLEENICPDDYPIIRLVPSRLLSGYALTARKAELLIYFGMPIAPFDEEPDDDGRVRLEKLYAALFEIEGLIRAEIITMGGVYLETITDEDRLDTYKLMAIRCEVSG
ncbi:hypothetical protein [Accumulibacter sp.]|uniref:hypothetical protein n=1 Tax=Accumulibacter sp. TaxID=2053492 RepID=UPI0028C4E269|nr:hypothetical protein [Accumulibacter sp.]